MSVTLEVSKLSGWLNADASCRESKGGHTVRGVVWRKAAGDRGARRVQGRARLQIRGRERGGAHVEHGVHVFDVGGVPVQRLVECQRVLPSRKEGIRCGARCGLGGGRRRATAGYTARRGGLDCRFGAGNGEERTWNMRYMFVTLDVSKASGWLNALAVCRESNEGHTRCGARCGPGGGERWWATAVQAGRREDSTADSGQGTGRSARKTCGTCS